MEFLFTVEGDFQLSSWSPFLESFKNHQKETNIAAKIKVVNICSNCGLEGFQEKGGMGGGGSPCGGEIKHYGLILPQKCPTLLDIL